MENTLFEMASHLSLPSNSDMERFVLGNVIAKVLPNINIRNSSVGTFLNTYQDEIQQLLNQGLPIPESLNIGNDILDTIFNSITSHLSVETSTTNKSTINKWEDTTDIKPQSSIFDFITGFRTVSTFDLGSDLSRENSFYSAT